MPGVARWLHGAREGLRLALSAVLALLLLAGVPLLPRHAEAQPSESVQRVLLHQESSQDDLAAEPSQEGPSEEAAMTAPEAGTQPEADQTEGDDGAEPSTTETEEEGSPVERATLSSRGGPRPSSMAEAPAGERVAAIARKYVGYRYAWAGSSPQVGFDCSGLDEHVYQEAGIPIPPHDLWGQMNTGPMIPRGELQPGDLVFFQNTYKPGLSHGGIYLGNAQFVHATDEGSGVQISSLSEDYWTVRFLAASRPWAAESNR